MPDPPWQASLDFLRDLHSVPAAQANAITLAQARGRWQHAVIARTSMHDLLFTLPGDDFPFASSVRVQSANGRHVLLRWENDRLVEENAADVGTIDALLDTFLERLTSPALTCRHCGQLGVRRALDVLGRLEPTPVFGNKTLECRLIQASDAQGDRARALVNGSELTWIKFASADLGLHQIGVPRGAGCR